MDDTRESLLIISNNRAITIASGDSYDFKNGDRLVLPADTVIEQLKFQGNDLVVKNKDDDFVIKNFLSFQQEGAFHLIPLLLAEHVTLSPLALLDQLSLPVYNTEQLTPSLVQNISMIEHIDSGVNDTSSLDDDRDDHDWSIIHSNTTFNRKISIINAQTDNSFGELNSIHTHPLIQQFRFDNPSFLNDQGNDESSSNDDNGRSTERETTAMLTAVVIDRNAAPVIIANGSLSNILEDEINPAGDSITSLIGSSFSDADFGDGQGVAIVDADNSNGQWQHTTDGTFWKDITALSDSNAVLLQSADPNTRVRFVPDADHSGSSGNLTYRAWDKTTGSNGNTGVNVSTNGGSTAYSSTTETASLTVTAVNDAPVLDNSGNMSHSSIHEDHTANGGDLISALIASAGGDRITDSDGDPEGVAVYNLAASNGSWEYRIAAGSWTAVGVIDGSNALLLGANDSLRYIPDTENGESASFDVYAWDGTSGVAGSKVDVSTRGGATAFSSANENITISVTDLNDAPTISGNGTLSNVIEDDTNPSGDTITNLLAATVSDVDSVAVEGIAVTGADNTNGQWQYTTNGSSWNNITGVNDSNAILLQSGDVNTSVRFVPDADHTGSSGILTYRAWDRSSGSNGDTAVDVSTNGGTTAYSSSNETASLTVTAVNDAPVLDNSGNMSHSSIHEDHTANGGDLISTLIASAGGDRITDSDGDPEGVAVYNLAASNGSWEYRIAAGSWTAVGVIDGSNALLLGANDSLRYIPDTENGESASFDVYAWDGTSGVAGSKVDVSTRGGTTAFSSASENITISVTHLNDAPTISGNGTLSHVVEDDTNPSGDTITSLLAATVSDVDSVAVEGIAVTGADNTNGQWQYTTNGSSWNNITGVNDSNAILLQSGDVNTSVRFVPDADHTGSSGNLTYRAWGRSSGSNGDTAVDVSTNGGTTAYSSSSETASLSVTAINDAPVLDNTGTMILSPINEDNTTSSGDLVSAIIASGLGDRITDVDSGDPEGIAIHNVTSSVSGSWEYRIGAGSWTAVGSVATNNALLLAASDSLRFIPDTSNGETASVDFYAWDQSTGTTGSKVDATTRGETTPFSTATENASISVSDVNDAPVLDNSGSMSMTGINEDNVSSSGDTVDNIILTAGGNRITDVDSGAVEGMAIYNLSSNNGHWEYRIGAGSWTDIGAVDANNALLLAAGDSVRFMPDSANGESVSFDFYAWDQSSGTAGSKVDVSTRDGTSAFSTVSENVSMTVSSVNDAPVLDISGNMRLTSVIEDVSNPNGDRITDIIESAGGNRISDFDSGAVEGIAVTAVDDSNGTWYFTLNGGTLWTPFGAVADNSAALLDTSTNTKIRFIPDAGFSGSASISFRAWDQSSGSNGDIGVDTTSNGGTMAFSTANESADIGVYPLNFNVSEIDGNNGFSLNGEAAGDRSGWAVSEVGDVNGDGFDDFLVGSGESGSGTREVHLIYGKSGGYTNPFELSTLTSGDGMSITLAGGGNFGAALRGLGDINNDGYDDFAISNYHSDIGGSNRGASYVIFGSSSLGASIDVSTLNGTTGFALYGINDNDYSGRNLSGIGDINADGFDDYIIAGSNADPNDEDSGEAYVIFGHGGSYSASYNISSLINGTDGFVLNGEDEDDIAGIALGGGGDYNNDGYADLLIGAREADTSNGSSSGQAYVYFGKATGFSSTIELSALSGSDGFTMEGLVSGDRLGTAINDAGDINGDGIDDFIVTAYFADPNGSRSGQSYVVFGSNSAFPADFDLSTLNGSNGFTINGIAAGDKSGFGGESIGDFNADGYDDIMIGSEAEPGGSNSGQGYIIYGASGFGATMNLSSLDGKLGFNVNGTVANGYLSALPHDHSGTGDIDGDGYADVIVAAPDTAPNGSLSGTSYVIYGHSYDTTHQGTAGNDSLSGDANSNTLVGGLGDDLLDGGAGVDVQYGANGDDYLVFDSSDRRIDGGNGNDFLSIEGGGTHIIDSKVKNIENFYIDDNNYNLTITHPEGLSSIDASGLTGSNSLTLDMSAHIFAVSISSGAGDDSIQGGVGADIIDTGAGNDTIFYDKTDLAGFSSLRIDGGIGSDDTYSFNDAGQVLNLTVIDNNVIKGVERIDLTGTGDNSLTLDISDVLDISSTTDTLYVDGNSGDSVIDSDQGWTYQGISGNYYHYTDAAATLYVDMDISMINLT